MRFFALAAAAVLAIKVEDNMVITEADLAELDAQDDPIADGGDGDPAADGGDPLPAPDTDDGGDTPAPGGDNAGGGSDPVLPAPDNGGDTPTPGDNSDDNKGGDGGDTPAPDTDDNKDDNKGGDDAGDKDDGEPNFDDIVNDHEDPPPAKLPEYKNGHPSQQRFDKKGTTKSGWNYRNLMNRDGVAQVYATPVNKYTSGMLRIMLVADFMTADGRPNKKCKKFNWNTLKKYETVTMYKGHPLMKYWCNPRYGTCDAIWKKLKKVHKLVVL